MSGSLPWGAATQMPPATNPNEAFRRVERNTAEMVTWMKILVVVMVISIAVNVFLLA